MTDDVKYRVAKTDYGTKAAPAVGDVGIVLERRHVGSKLEAWYFQPEGKKAWWMLAYQLEPQP